jgi:NAD(P)-dependent dehydrogenase (short-subunit alcohol dehydrogenase family)
LDLYLQKTHNYKKVALITGGSGGIGLGIVEELAKNGFDLWPL